MQAGGPAGRGTGSGKAGRDRGPPHPRRGVMQPGPAAAPHYPVASGMSGSRAPVGGFSCPCAGRDPPATASDSRSGHAVFSWAGSSSADAGRRKANGSLRATTSMRPRRPKRCSWVGGTPAGEGGVGSCGGPRGTPTEVTRPSMSRGGEPPVGAEPRGSSPSKKRKSPGVSPSACAMCAGGKRSWRQRLR